MRLTLAGIRGSRREAPSGSGGRWRAIAVAVVVVGLATIGWRTDVVRAASGDSTATTWEGWRPLMGDWIGEGDGAPGHGSGAFSFALDLQGRILVRRSFAEYPAAPGRPASRHDDLMMLRHEDGSGRVRALYLDNEGHAIDYTARVSAARDTFEFVSEPAPGTPRFRLTYVVTGADALRLRFEVAPPGRPDSLATYLEANARRRQPRR